MEKKLYRSKTNRVFLGVCGGLGEYFGIDPVLVRLIFVFSILILGPLSLLLYVLFAIVIPEVPWYEERKDEKSSIEISSRGNEFLGWILLVLGVYFLGKTLGIVVFSFRLILAIVLIIIGILIILKK